MLNFYNDFLVDTKQLLIGTRFNILVILRTFESSKQTKKHLIRF